MAYVLKEINYISQRYMTIQGLCAIVVKWEEN